MFSFRLDTPLSNCMSDLYKMYLHHSSQLGRDFHLREQAALRCSPPLPPAPSREAVPQSDTEPSNLPISVFSFLIPPVVSFRAGNWLTGPVFIPSPPASAGSVPVVPDGLSRRRRDSRISGAPLWNKWRLSRCARWGTATTLFGGSPPSPALG